MPYGEPTLLEFQGTDLIAVNYELSAEDEELAQNDDMIRFMLKGEEFTQELTELGASYNLAFNGAATRKYTPKTLKFE